MLNQILTLYAASWLVCALVAAGLEWAQLVRTRPLPPPADLARTLTMGWIVLPLAAPALALAPLIRRAGRRDAARAGA